MTKRDALLFSCTAWLLAAGLALLLRFYGTAETMDWMVNHINLHAG